MSATRRPPTASSAWATPTPATWAIPLTRPRQAKSAPRRRGSVERCSNIRPRFSIDDKHIPRSGKRTNTTGDLVNDPNSTSIAAVAASPPAKARRSCARRTTTVSSTMLATAPPPTSADSRPGPRSPSLSALSATTTSRTSNAPITRFRAADTPMTPTAQLRSRSSAPAPRRACRGAVSLGTVRARTRGEGLQTVATQAMALPMAQAASTAVEPPMPPTMAAHSPTTVIRCASTKRCIRAFFKAPPC